LSKNKTRGISANDLDRGRSVFSRVAPLDRVGGREIPAMVGEAEKDVQPERIEKAPGRKVGGFLFK
jgi:hypothetical protein